MEVGLVRKVDIDREMQQSYLDFAMSVIVSRALPDARDGLKPVQRRILYAMYDMGLRPDSDFKKSARIVGEVLGKYHPHGDMAVYEAMARQAQDFSMRYPLVDGQGNFGSVDGDPPAAMRYTEARLKSYAVDMLAQIDRDTVDFAPNFDGSLNEPAVLPAALPNLLVNGSTGIAVGMATNIPPHNLAEVVDALVYMLREWERLDDINVADLMNFINGPDFPTGGIILQNEEMDLLTAYGSGRGRVLVRGRVHMEDTGRGRSRLIITELPYMTNKSNLIERIAELAREGDLDGIADLRDESDRQGMRIVVELKANIEAEDILRKLYKRTPLETTIGITLLALVDNEPRLLSLKQALRVYLEHRQTVVRRRAEYDLERARQRAHVLEGLRIAIANLDEVIKVIRAAADVDQARERLMKRFKLSLVQANAILEMPLRRLAALERKKIEDEYKELVRLMKDLEALLKSPKKMREVVQAELLEMKEKYGDRRRTQIVSLREGETAHMLLTATDLISAETAWVGITAEGLIGRIRGGETPQMDGRYAPRWMVRTNTHHTLYMVSPQGQAVAVAVHAIPEVSRLEEGVPLHRVSALPDGEMLAGLFTVPPRNGDPHADRFVMTASAQGLVKKSSVAELPGPSSQRFALARVNPGDWLIGTVLTGGSDELLMVSAHGMAIRFAESEVRAMGLVAAGVNGMKLGAGDQVVGFTRYQAERDVLLVASNGAGWRISTKEFPLQGRYGMGVIAARPAPRESIAGILLGKPGQAGLLHFDPVNAQPVRVDAIPAVKRQAGARPLGGGKGAVITGLSAAADGLEYWNPEAALPVEPPARKRATAVKTQAEPAAIKSSVKTSAAAAKKPVAGKTAAATKSTAAGKTAAPKKPAADTKTTKAATAAAKTPTAVEAKPAARKSGAKAAAAEQAVKPPAARKSTAKTVQAPAQGAVKTAAKRATSAAKPAEIPTKPAAKATRAAARPAAETPAKAVPKTTTKAAPKSSTPVAKTRAATKAGETPAAKGSKKPVAKPRSTVKSAGKDEPAAKPRAATKKPPAQPTLQLFEDEEAPKPAHKKKGAG